MVNFHNLIIRHLADSGLLNLQIENVVSKYIRLQHILASEEMYSKVKIID